jgi:four helix bundle protein
MSPEELKARTKKFGLRIIKLYEELSNTRKGEILGNQLLRAGTSVGTNYRAACRAKSDADFLYKIEIVEEEADESAYWLGMISESNIVKKDRLDDLLKEANELIAIFTSSGRTVKQKRKSKPNLIGNNPKSEIRNSK